MTLLCELNFHDIARAEATPSRRGSNHWTTIALYNSAGEIIAEVCLFSNGDWPVVITPKEAA